MTPIVPGVVPPRPPDKLYTSCDTSQFGFGTTAELEDLDEFIGQPRAASSLEFAVGVRRQGYNLFVMGPAGAGKHAMVGQFLTACARGEPRPCAAPEIAAVYAAYPHLGPVLPAMGYTPQQLNSLAQTINATPADVVVSAAPIDLAALIPLNKPVIRARYEFADIEDPGLAGIVDGYLQRSGLATREE